ncbi:hypothetical protein ACE1B6_22050 [Aerosakkonemataceae cyanobacterium BLCC-F154]|uniref:Uncharacterized protein n=1 Tax=Floridaenema fluviatile BLCC-F154 TaxID=3153640 RepID=A0ABV4YGH4_9CYAN
MLSHDPDQVQIADWKFVETWIDPTLEIPYLLMLVGDIAGNYKVYDPKENYKVIYSSRDYEEVKLFLLEDEYEQVEGRYEE